MGFILEPLPRELIAIDVHNRPHALSHPCTKLFFFVFFGMKFSKVSVLVYFLYTYIQSLNTKLNPELNPIVSVLAYFLYTVTILEEVYGRSERASERAREREREREEGREGGRERVEGDFQKRSEDLDVRGFSLVTI
jgi:hypothetical protein